MNAEALPESVAIHAIRMDLQGRLRNTKVAASNAFQPVFEAVVNSMHSIEDRFGRENAAAMGKIEIHVHRVLQHQVPGMDGMQRIEPVEGFTVVDNGEGFTDRNLESFETADSLAKIERGGKGIGRLTWLVVFERAEIKSQFLSEEDGLRRRSFTFSPSYTGISGFSEEELESEQELETRISLKGVRQRYREPLRKELENIAERVFEHCFNYFAVGKCPQVVIIDHGADSDRRVVVNDLIQQVAIGAPEKFEVGSHELALRHVQQPHTKGKKHLGHLLANDRVVSSFLLADVSDLGKEPIRGKQGEPLMHHVFVSGPALDASANATRTKFDLPDGESLVEAMGDLDLQVLRQKVGVSVNDRLKDTLLAEREANLKKIELHIRTKQPEYARLLREKRHEISRIKWSDDSRRTDQDLYRIKQDWEYEIRRQQLVIEEQLVKDETDVDTMEEELYRVVSQTNLAGQDDLVRYVLKRRAVLNLVHKLISKQRATHERHIHGIVFPLRKTNGEIDYHDHNLWLVDDALAFYEFVASDIPLSKNVAAPSSSLSRPDILAFKEGDPYQHISIVEFKRPDRNDGENPVVQMVSYGRALRDGGATDVNGVTMPGVSMNVGIDAYAIVTLNPKMESVIRDGPGEMMRAESGRRWYGAMRNLNMSIEVLDYNEFISRARKRNRAFFNSLNLP